MGRPDLAEHAGPLGRIISVGRQDNVSQRDAVVGIAYRMHLVPVELLLAAFHFAVGANAPTRCGVAVRFPSSIHASLNISGRDGHDLAHRRIRGAFLRRNGVRKSGRQALNRPLNQVGMASQALEKPADYAGVGYGVAESAEPPDLRVGP